ncbi:hypothetical protein Syun_028267 [Stephania yunnanensis]|uniref:CAND6/7 N-terminal domain-containing protein n=1 Tax=Stephania yunnanensis TaxID=152371 RepID=A0AAP0EH20_9MAGN
MSANQQPLTNRCLPHVLDQATKQQQLFPCCFVVSLSTSSAEIRISEIRSDDRSIIPFDEFGFTHNGRLELLVSHISLSNPNPDLDLSLLGFFLSTRDSWIHVLRQIQDLEITCALHSDSVHLVYSFERLEPPNPNPNSFARIGSLGSKNYGGLEAIHGDGFILVLEGYSTHITAKFFKKIMKAWYFFINVSLQPSL